MDAYPIRYEFRFDDGKLATFTVHLHPKTLEVIDPPPEEIPDWARLERDRCPDCPLPTGMTFCPTAAHLSGVVEQFAQTFSITEADVRVVTPERTYQRRSAVQSSLSSLIGVYMVSSGCPILAKLRPMVRFHLPFASALETTWRAASMYLLAQHQLARAGRTPDWDLTRLAEVYRQVAVVNRAFAHRLRQAAPLDANINALVLLDVFAKVMPSSIEDGLSELSELFAPWMR